MCELTKAGFPKDCSICKDGFFETFTMCPERNPGIDQEMYDEIYQEWDD